MSELLALILSAVFFYAIPDSLPCWHPTWHEWGDDFGICYTYEFCLSLYPVSLIGAASKFCNETFMMNTLENGL